MLAYCANFGKSDLKQKNIPESVNKNTTLCGFQ